MDENEQKTRVDSGTVLTQVTRSNISDSAPSQPG